MTDITLTAETAEAARAHADAKLTDARNLVALYASDGADYERLTVAVLAVAEAEGELVLLARVAHAMARGFDAAYVRKVALEALVRGADDAWSGRSNDARRAAYDGTRRAAGWVAEQTEM